MVPDEGTNSAAAPGGYGDGVMNDVKQRGASGMAAPLVAPVMPAAWGEKKMKGLRGRKTFAVI